jgi:hypothetical protein
LSLCPNWRSWPLGVKILCSLLHSSKGYICRVWSPLGVYEGLIIHPKGKLGKVAENCDYSIGPVFLIIIIAI